MATSLASKYSFKTTFKAVRGALSHSLPRVYSVFLAECVAVRERLPFAIKHSLPLKDIKSDSKNIVSTIVTS
ncbi:hypothetical protein PanWU01x14_336710 [Parasponia andersonii]|uniref:Uncharacterized protein n=1 Tax=Parasponia andersonii TaxID=3476 RepID=A0A2P5AFS0_PARAD|nr:hypothetical protein PanWU01x14_336710 [Parasponia andersonii]